MSIETKQLHALSKIYQEAVYGGAKKKSTDMVVTNADKKANTPAYKNYKAGVKGYKAADHLKNEDAQYGYDKDGNSLNPKDKKKKSVKEGMKQARKNVGADKCWDGYKAKGTKKKGGKEVPNCVEEGKKAAKDYDGDGKIESGKAEYFGSKDKAIKKAMKKESYSDWRQDLKEIPDYDQIPTDSKKNNEKISEKKVKNTVKINPTMEEETQVDEGVYEKQKTKEVMGALKKRDLKKDVKAKIAADIVKRKGDTSKSDDRYAYESKLWDEVAAHLTELGNLNDADFRVEGYQRNPEKGEEEARKAKRERKGGYDEKRERRMNDPKKGINSPAFQEFMRSRGM